MALLTPEQQAKARRAIAGGRGCGDTWASGGPLSLIAEAEGVTRSELERWDTVANGDGPLTVRRVKESGNAFGGWPLSFLEALDTAWKASGGDAESTLSVLRRWLEPPDTPKPETDVAYDGPERRSSLSLNIDVKSIIAVIGFVALVMPGLLFLLQLRVDLRQNTADDVRREAESAAESAGIRNEIAALKATAAKFERAHSIYCSGLRRDSTRSPDADC